MAKAMKGDESARPSYQLNINIYIYIERIPTVLLMQCTVFAFFWRHVLHGCSHCIIPELPSTRDRVVQSPKFL